ncbi:MAG: ArsA-related P-loop ATPase [Myxococcota bacterium]
MGTRIRVVTGKGGVGKTTVAAAYGLALAGQNRRVLLAEVNGGERITPLLGAAPVGSTMREVVENLHVVDMNPRDSIREYVLQTFRFESVYNTVFENRFVRQFLRLVPSLSELVMLGKVWFHHQETREDGTPRFDDIIVDAPATGHAISMLRAPTVVQRTVPAGPLRDNCKDIVEMLRLRGTLHIVTLPEEMPVSEALELTSAAHHRIDIRLGEAFINQRLTALPAGAVDPLLSERGWRAELGDALSIRDSKCLNGEEQLRRLSASLLDGAISLPHQVDLDLPALARRIGEAIQ